MRTLILAVVAMLAFGSPVLAGPVTLKVNPVDLDGPVTLGDLFDGAGAASGVVIGNRVGPSVVFEASQLQSLARQAGLDWANPTGLRRVVVRHAAVAPVTPVPGTVAGATEVASPVAPRSAPAHSAYADRVINRNDLVEVAYEAGGIRLTITGRAQRNAVVGERFPVLNPTSGRTIDALAVGPGQAIAGPTARTASAPQQTAAR